MRFRQFNNDPYRLSPWPHRVTITLSLVSLIGVALLIGGAL